MTIADLIALLQKFPPQTKVLVQGYEDGYDNITAVKSVPVKPNPDAQWYNGTYVDAEGSGAENAVLVFSEERMKN
jgi:hypothetical protein